MSEQERDLKAAAKEIIDYCGEDNIKKVYCCITRLRLNFNDKEKVNYEALGNMDIVKGTFWYGSEFQLVIGLEVLNLSEIVKIYLGI